MRENAFLCQSISESAYKSFPSCGGTGIEQLGAVDFQGIILEFGGLGTQVQGDVVQVQGTVRDLLK